MATRLDAILDLTRTRPSDPFAWYALAMEYRTAGRAADAEDVFRRLMRDFSDYVPTYLMAGQFFAEAGRAGDAREALSLGREAATRMGNAHARGEIEALLASLE